MYLVEPSGSPRVDIVAKMLIITSAKLLCDSLDGVHFISPFLRHRLTQINTDYTDLFSFKEVFANGNLNLFWF